ncbi:MAG TPA: serine hydrolase [Nitrososphaeraceae archaeon]|nr:serine hydrolase [Nitrososphaeraceae archaeon]
MSNKILHSLFKIICSNRSFVLFATIVLSGVLLDNTISSANSILNASSSSSSVYSMSTTTAATPLKPLTHTGVKNAKGNSTFTISYKLKKEINSHIDNGSNAAIVIGLVDPNGTQFYGYGKMSNANQTTVDKNTVFGIGSITKSFTTLLLTDIANRGIVNLNDPIKKYLPSTVKVPTYNGVEITLEDLATHTSGLPHDPPNMPLNGPGFQKYTLEQLYQALSSIKLTSAPGSKYHYSNFGMALLGDILSSKAGMPYEQLVINRILNVLGMNSTRITLSDTLKSRLAIGHRNGRELHTIENPLPYAPAGGFRSTASDMVKYLSANMGLAKSNLSTAMGISHQPRFNTNLTGFSSHNRIYIGLAWFTTAPFGNMDTSTNKIIWDNGQFNGYNGFIGFNPNKQKGVVILCSGVQRNLRVSQIGFGPYDNLSNLIWTLLN